tara:strand:- start:395 stop:754 length:360 start_codon:yes stop_codon:yes gene_type:complete
MAKRKGSGLEETFAIQCKLYNLPTPQTELRFHPVRRWRLDFAWPSVMLAVEIHGGEYSRGRHVRGKGFVNDCEKIAHAALEGWTVIPLAGTQVKNGLGIQWIVEWFQKYGADADGRNNY